MYEKRGKWKHLRMTLLVVDMKTTDSKSNLLCVDGYFPIFWLDRFYDCFFFFFNWKLGIFFYSYSIYQNVSDKAEEVK